FREETYDHDLKVDERGNATRWEHEHAEHELSEDDLLSILTTDTAAVVVGCGHHGQLRLSPEAKRLIDDKKLELHFFQTPEAVKQYNEIRDSRKTVAFVHATC
ncbi:hypothetical protein HYS54_04790, partial [Candidatus Micrarchaeota archaeon]|nr:hypothetical protein [Candidatus Micrarchaeota archaeon]